MTEEFVQEVIFQRLETIIEGKLPGMTLTNVSLFMGIKLKRHFFLEKNSLNNRKSSLRPWSQ
jgi:hypothetical protein